jgi:hypothetical protein
MLPASFMLTVIPNGMNTKTEVNSPSVRTVFDIVPNSQGTKLHYRQGQARTACLIKIILSPTAGQVLASLPFLAPFLPVILPSGYRPGQANL